MDSSIASDSGETPKLDMIDKNLYLAGLMDVVNVDTLKQHNITHILTVNTIPLPEFLKEVCPYLNTKFIMTDDLPDADLLSHFDESYEFLQEGVSQGAVVVHCMVGLSRSATLVIAYLMKKYKLNFLGALDMVRKTRPVCPNIGFVKQLEKYEKLGYCTDSQQYS